MWCEFKGSKLDPCRNQCVLTVCLETQNRKKKWMESWRWEAKKGKERRSSRKKDWEGGDWEPWQYDIVVTNSHTVVSEMFGSFSTFCFAVSCLQSLFLQDGVSGRLCYRYVQGALQVFSITHFHTEQWGNAEQGFWGKSLQQRIPHIAL